jgi:hypothetical protein
MRVEARSIRRRRTSFIGTHLASRVPSPAHPPHSRRQSGHVRSVARALRATIVIRSGAPGATTGSRRLHPFLPPSSPRRVARALRRDVRSCSTSRVQRMGFRPTRRARVDLLALRDATAGRLGQKRPWRSVDERRSGPSTHPAACCRDRLSSAALRASGPAQDHRRQAVADRQVRLPDRPSVIHTGIDERGQLSTIRAVQRLGPMG